MKKFLLSISNQFRFKQTIDDFFVEEIPLKKFQDRGRFLILKVKKRGSTTWEMIDILKRVSGERVGYAGLKDKNATTIQYVSIHERAYKSLRSFKHSKIEIMEIKRSATPIKVGELQANRFVINLYDVKDIKKLKSDAKLIAKKGVPNYFGYQRFGNNSIEQAKEFVEGDFFTKDKKLQRMLIAIYQSYLFNKWLKKRVAMSDKHFKLLRGDLCIKDEELFYIESEDEKQLFEGVVPTGLLPGKGVQKARKSAREIEALFDIYIPSKGYRRAALFYPRDLSFKQEEDRIVLTFTLPKSSYATTFIENLAGKEITYKGIE